MMKWNATVRFTDEWVLVCVGGLVVVVWGGTGDQRERCSVSRCANRCLKMQIYSAADWQLTASYAARPSAKHVSLSVFFFFFYICLSRTLSGEQSSLCWPSTRSENRSNHLFIDWNIRRLRGSEGAAATKSGKDRLAGGIREGGEGEGGGGRRVAVVEGMGVKLSAEQRRGDDCWANKKGTVCLHKTTSQQTNKRQPSDGEGAERGYSSSNTVRRRRV